MRRSPSLACSRSSRLARFALVFCGAAAMLAPPASAQAGPTGVQGAAMGSDQPGVNFDGTGSSCRDPFQLTVVSNPGDGSTSTTLTQLDAVVLSTLYPTVSEIDIALAAEAMWVISRSYNISVDSTGDQSLHYQGVGWFQNSQPEILFVAGQSAAGDVVQLVYAADKYVAYKRASETSTAFLGMNGAAGIFEFVAGTGSDVDLWTLTDLHGWQATFVGFDGDAGDQAGQLWKIISPSGASAFVGASTSIADARTAGGWGTSGRIAKAFDSVDRRYTYAFSAIDSVQRLASVTVETRSGSSWASPGTITQVAKVEYDYYAGSADSNGSSGSLRMVTRTTPMSDSGVSLTERKYFRYWKNTAPTPDYLMLVLDYEGARRFDWTKDADASFDNDFLSESTANLKPYAAAYLEYDSSRRVNSALFNGQCGCSGGGASGVHTLVYATNPSFSGTGGYDTAWHHRAVIGRPDGSYVTQYFDEMGQPLSNIVSTSNPASSSPTPTHYATKVVRSSTSHVTEVWTPDSIASYTHDTSGSPTGSFTSDSAGLIHLYTRVSSGAATGYLSDEKWRDIASSSEYFVRSLTWDTTTATKTIASQTLARPLLASAREYTQAITSGTTGSNLTSFAYTVHSTSALAIKKITETKPTVSTGNNGSGATHYVYTQLRADGRMEYRAEKDLETGGRKFVEQRTYTSTGQLDTRYEDATVTSGENSDTDFQSDSGALDESEVHTYDAQGRLVTQTTHDGRTLYNYYSVLADRRTAQISFPDYTTSGGTKYWGPASYSVANHAGRTELSATLAFDSNYTTYGTTYFVTEDDADPITSIGDGVTLGELRFMVTSLHDNSGNRLTERREYYLTPTSGAGTDGTNYDATTFAYDGMGRRIRAKAPHSTITRTVFDGRGLVTERWEGTNDTGSAGSDTTGTPDIVKTEALAYDNNGQITSEIRYTASATGRTTTYTADVRGRPVLVTNPTAPHTFNKFDNLGRVIASGEYSSTASINLATDDPTTETANRWALSERAYDERGRVYLSKRHKIDTADGSDDDNLESLTWYDEIGRVLKVDGEQLAKYRYDRLGRRTHEFVLASDNDSAFGDVDDVTGDIVLEEHQSTFDGDGYVTMSATIQRLYDDVGTNQNTGALDTNADGDLGVYTESNVKGRIQISAYWYDYLGRETDRAEFGTNGSGNVSTFTRSSYSTAPSRSDTVLVTSTSYNKDGTVDLTTDPKAQQTKFLYDHLGRKTAEIGNYGNGVPTSPEETTTDDNYVRYEYTDGLMTALWVDYDGDGTKDTTAPKDQVTLYFHGTKVGTPSASSIATGHLLRAVKYPDSTNAGTTTSYFEDSTHLDDVVTYCYNAQGEEVQKRDQAGNVVDTSYDSRGRETARTVATLASGFDGAVRQIATTYDSLGRTQLVTQYDGATPPAVTDEVKFLYDGWGNLSNFRQDHDTVVGTSGFYEVSYESAKATSGRNTIRRSIMWLPDSNKYFFTYATTSSHDGAASRVTTLQTEAATDLVTYDYNGAGSVVRTYLQEPDVYSSLFGASGTSFSWLDRFDRPIASKWTKDLSTDRDFYSFAIGWDRNSNVTYQDDLVLPGHDVAYANDALDRLTTADEGTLTSGSITSRKRKQEWTLTRTGNWSIDKVDLNGDGDWGDTGDLNDTRTHNEVNELTSRDTNSTSPAEFNFTYDAVGNMTSDGEAYKFVWDAFGRLRKATTLADALVSEYWYNGLGYRIRWHYDNKATFGVVNGTDKIYHFVYEERWRIVATYRESDSLPKEQFLYHCAGAGGYGGSSYIDSVLLRDKDASTAWTAAANALDERIYYCQNWRADVVAIVDDTGHMKEQDRYSAYGVPFGIPLGDVDADGDCDTDDATLVDGWKVSGPYHVEGDLDLDGDNDADDLAAVQANEGAGLGRGQLSDRGLGSRKGYAGYEFDENVGQKYHVRNRVFAAVLGRWLMRDHAEYIDGPNFLVYGVNSPISVTDADGEMASCWCKPLARITPTKKGGGWTLEGQIDSKTRGNCCCRGSNCEFELRIGISRPARGGKRMSFGNSAQESGPNKKARDEWHSGSDGEHLEWSGRNVEFSDRFPSQAGEPGFPKNKLAIGESDSGDKASQPFGRYALACGDDLVFYVCAKAGGSPQNVKLVAGQTEYRGSGKKNRIICAKVHLRCVDCKL